MAVLGCRLSLFCCRCWMCECALDARVTVSVCVGGVNQVSARRGVRKAKNPRCCLETGFCDLKLY